MGYFENRRPWANSNDDGQYMQNEIYKADAADVGECRFYERIQEKRYSEPEASFGEVNIIYPFIDRNLNISQWTKQDDGSFVFNIDGKNAVITFEDGEILATRWDGIQIYADSLYSLENFLIRR